VPGAGNPQAYNRYAYVLNNPIRYNDPTGHMCSDPDDLWSPGCDGSGGRPKNTPAPLPDGPVVINNPDPLDDGQEQDDPTPDPKPSVDCNIQTCIGQPDYWDLNPLHPDYYTLALSYGFGSATFTVDRYAQAYWAFGGSLNTTYIAGPPGVSFMASHIGQPFLESSIGPMPNVNNISSFLTGFSGNISAGAGPAGGLTFSPGSDIPNYFGTVSTIGVDAGVSTPFAGGSVTYGFQIQNSAVNRFAISFMREVKSLLP